MKGEAGNYRDKIISDNIAFCLRHRHNLTDWERVFVESVDARSQDLTQKQFNILQHIAAKLSRHVIGIRSKESGQ